MTEAAGRWGGAEGNERLTAMTGTVLLILLAAEGFTILSVRRMLTLHFFLGMLLLGPVVLKAGSTLYRFYRYYTGSAPYRRKGPPELALRLLGPLVMLSTAGVFGSGVALAIAGPGPGPWLFLHKASFIVWFCVMTAHVLAYLPRLPRLLSAEIRGTATSLPPAVGPRPPRYAPPPPQGQPAGYGPPAPQGQPAGYDPPAGYGPPPRQGPPAGYGPQAPRSPAAGYHPQAAQGPAAGYGPSPGYGPPAGYGRPGSYTARAAAVLGGRGMRVSLLVASLLAGLVIAALTLHLATPWYQPFLHG